MKVALTGATGIVGFFVIRELKRHGVFIRALKRESSDVSKLPGVTEWVTGDFSSEPVMKTLLKGVDALIHCGFEHVAGCYRGGEGEDLGRWLDVNLQGTLRLMMTARAMGVKRCIILSSRAVYGDWRQFDTLVETDGLRPDTHYGALKMAIEAFVHSYGLGEGWDVAAIRSTGIYGVVSPLDRSKWYDCVKATLRQEPWSRCRVATEVHGEDLARLIWVLLNKHSIAGEVYNCSDLVVSDVDIVTLVQQMTGVSGPLPDVGRSISSGVMACQACEKINFTFGGMRLLEKSINELVTAINLIKI